MGPTATHGGAAPRGLGVEKAFTRWRWIGRRRVPVLTGASIALSRGKVVGLVGERLGQDDLDAHPVGDGLAQRHHRRDVRTHPDAVRPVFGRVSGVFMAFPLPFIDLGLGQSPLRGNPADWARWTPGYGGMRVLIDGGLTASFDEGPMLAVAVAWIVLLSCAVVVLLRRTVKD